MWGKINMRARLIFLGIILLSLLGHVVFFRNACKAPTQQYMEDAIYACVREMTVQDIKRSVCISLEKEEGCSLRGEKLSIKNYIRQYVQKCVDEKTDKDNVCRVHIGDFF